MCLVLLDIGWLSEIMVSLSSTKVILFDIFLFSEKTPAECTSKMF